METLSSSPRRSVSARTADDGLTPARLVDHLPCEVWLDAMDRWEGIGLRGVNCDPFRISSHLRCHTVVAYVEGERRVARRFGDCRLDEVMQPGDLALKGHGTAGEWMWERTTNTIQVYLAPELLDGVAAEVYGPAVGTWRVRDSLKTRDDELLHLVHALAREADSAEPGSALMVRLLSRQLAVGLIRRHADPVPRALGARPQFDLHGRHDIARFISDHLGNHLSVAQMALHANLSTEHFSRLFRNTFGCTPHQHLLEQRLQRACEMMDDPSRPLAEIACEAGFADQSHLTRSFKARFGVPPSTWRARHERTVALQ